MNLIPNYKVAFVTTLFLIDIPAFAAQPVQFKDHSSYQQGTPYGSLIFNRDAKTVGEHRRFKRFIRIAGNGETLLDQQDGYCFYLNHYKEVNDGKRKSYTVKSTKHLNDSGKLVEVTKGYFTPAGWPGSSGGPDFCIEELRDVHKVELEFSSTAGRAFSWNITFKRDPV